MNEPQYLMESRARERMLNGQTVERGTFVVERQNAGAMLAQSRNLSIRPFDLFYRPARHEAIDPGSTVLFVRPGGYGDLLFCTPVFRRLKEMGCRVEVACFPQFAPILEANTDIYGLVPYPVPVEIWKAADHHVWLERILEDGVDGIPETLTWHATDLIAKACGLKLEDKSMRYDVTPGEAKWVKREYPHRGKPRVGIQLHASALNRSYPWKHLQVLAGLLAAEHFEVMLFGAPGSVPECEGPFVNLTAHNLTMRMSCAIVATCDAMVTPDSSLCHVAAALNIPTVALYGPFLSQTRTRYSPSVRAVNGKAPCAPCTFHDNTGVPWPAGCPGWKTGMCAALENIPPALIAAQVSCMIASRSNLECEMGTAK